MIDKNELIRPFDADQIRQRPGGKAGKDFDYVPAGDVIERLITATDNEFSWTVKRCELFYVESKPSFWLVEGTLTIPELGSRDGVGTHQALDLEAPKAATTDALKRAAVGFGVALELYQKSKPGAAASPAAAARPAQAVNGNVVINTAATQCAVCHAPPGKGHIKTCSVAIAEAAKAKAS